MGAALYAHKASIAVTLIRNINILCNEQDMPEKLVIVMPQALPCPFQSPTLIDGV